jgi:ABC-type glycerol-3-phosphate transport system substrate-binding protein
MKNITRLIGFGYLVIAIAAVIANSLLGSIGYAPFPISVGPAPEPVVVTIWYGTEKKEWLEAAVKRFAETNPHQGRRPIQIKLVGIGSRELPLRVAAQDWRSDPQPTVISPASSIWV